MAAKLTERIRSLGHIANLVSAGSALAEVLGLIVMGVCQRSSWSSSAIMAADESIDYSVLVARFDPLFDTRNRSVDRWPLTTSPIRTVLGNRQPIVIGDAQSSSAFPGYQREALERDYHTVVILPFSTVDEHGRGLVLSVHSHEPQEVNEEEIAFLETVALLGSLAVEKARRVQLDLMQKERLNAALDISQIAMEQVLTSEDLDPFAGLAARYLDKPFLLIDFTTNRLQAGCGASLPRGVEQRDVMRILALKMHDMESAQFDLVMQMSLSSSAPESRQAVIIEPCVAGDRVLGGIVLMADQPLDVAAALTAQQLRAALTVLLLRRHIRFEAEAETHGAYFARLFSADWRDHAAMLARAHHLGLALDEPARLAALRLPAASTAEGRRPDVEFAVARELRRMLPDATAFRDGDTLIVFLPERKGGAGAARKVLDQLLREVEWLIRTAPTACLGQVCRRLDDYPMARRTADTLLGLAAKLGRTGIVESSDFGPLARLIALTSADGLRDFVEETIGQIDRYDQAHDGQLLVTLEQYLAHRTRLQATADALGIHVTTIRYRLQRLTELFGLDLEDSETRAALDLALRVLRLVGGR